ESTEGNEKYHSFLILSREDSSMVTPLGVRLLEGVNQLQHIPMDSGLSNIVWCSVCDPYAVLLMADGSVILIEFIKSASGPKLTVSRPSLSQSSKVCACCTYKDMSGLFTTENSNLEEVSKVPSPKPEMTAPPRQEKDTQSSVSEEESLNVREVLLTGLGYKNRRATLVAVMDQDLLIYEAFSYPTVEGHLNLRFKKLQHNIQIREKKPKQEPKNDSETKPGLDPKVAMLRVFNDISSYSGVCMLQYIK
ncbi:predicted protein, partial [Nematostella vectensis]